MTAALATHEPEVSPPPVIELRDVNAGYKDLLVLNGVSLVAPRSSVVALLGPNGAGKTTLLRYASGLLGGQAGRLCINGEDTTGRPPYEIASRGVCHIPEGRGIYPSLTVRENIALFSPRFKPTDLVDTAVLAFPALKKKLGQVAGTLSGGEQQMLALSRAYVGSPAVVLLDEVSMGLAPKIVDEIFLSIEQLKKNGNSLILVEQYVDRALAIADRVYVLHRGTVRAHGFASDFSRERVVDSYLGVSAKHGLADPIK
jgi:branched-chain amino acid transport system ATP-binding protein